MKIRYDPDADALYIKLKEGKVDHTLEVDKNTLFDLDEKNQIIGIEILFVKERNPDLLKVKELNIEHFASA